MDVVVEWSDASLDPNGYHNGEMYDRSWPDVNMDEQK
jgi:hypothetical protein